MPEATIPNTLGFAEFVAKLIEETFEAIVSSQSEQERRYGEMLQAAELDSEAFAELMVPEVAIAEELSRLLPSDTPGQPHAIHVGASYKPARGRRLEKPAFRSMFGVVLERRDYIVSRRRGICLKRSAVDRISKAVRLRLATGQQEALRQSLQRGIPRLIIDSGSVSAKLTFQLIRVEDAESPDILPTLAAPIRPLSKSPKPISPELNKIRLLVRNANVQAPQENRPQTDVFGEVKVTFKTVL